MTAPVAASPSADDRMTGTVAPDKTAGLTGVLPDLAALKQQYEREGYVILDNIFAGQDMQALRRAAAEVTERTRNGGWPHRRIVGKQFPPFDRVQSSDSWGVQHLMHPDLTHHDLFAAFYGSSPLLDVAAYLLDAEEEQMQLELFNLLIEPKEHCFALGWHRDDVRPDVDAEEEKARLAAPTHGVQWNACLYDDDCLFIVPGTQARLRDQHERKANQEIPPPARPFYGEDDAGFDGAWSIDPPSTLRVSLKGETFEKDGTMNRALTTPSSAAQPDRLSFIPNVSYIALPTFPLEGGQRCTGATEK